MPQLPKSKPRRAAFHAATSRYRFFIELDLQHLNKLLNAQFQDALNTRQTLLTLFIRSQHFSNLHSPASQQLQKTIVNIDVVNCSVNRRGSESLAQQVNKRTQLYQQSMSKLMCDPRWLETGPLIKLKLQTFASFLERLHAYELREL